MRTRRWACATAALVVLMLPVATHALVRIPLHSPARPPRHKLNRHQAHLVTMMQEEEMPGHAWHHGASTKQPSHVALANIDDYLFSASVSIGSPPQNFTVMLDTGSTDAWVPGQSCTTCGSSHSQFRRSDSSSFTDLNQSFEGIYGSGTSDGIVVQDVLTLGEYAVPGFVFALITNETGDIPGFATDGVLGLAFPGMGKIIGQPTLLDALVATHADMEPVFAFRLTKESDPTPSEFHIGGLDITSVGEKPTVAYFPVVKLPGDDELTYWTIALDDFHTFTTSVDHRQILRSQDFCRPVCYAIIDSGSSLIYAPPQIYEDIIKSITHGRNCDLETLECHDTTATDFPSLSFTFGDGHSDGHVSTVKPNAFVLPPESYVDCEDGVCTINIMNHGEMGDDMFWWVLGDTFLQAYYTAFDFGEHKRVGIACDGDNPQCHIAP